MRTSRRFSCASRAIRKEGTVDLACLRRASAWAISIVCHSHASTDLDQLQEMCIGVDELLRHRKPCLKLPYLKVCVRCLGGYGDSSSNLFGLRSLEFVSSC